MSVLGTPEQGSSVVPIKTASIWDFERSTDSAVTGSRLISVIIER
jgi:hypothetical protein